jgi:hypothetical protein
MRVLPLFFVWQLPHPFISQQYILSGSLCAFAAIRPSWMWYRRWHCMAAVPRPTDAERISA